MSLTPAFDMQDQRAQLREARDHRSEIMDRVASGRCTVYDVVRLASLSHGKPLGRVRLAELLLASSDRDAEEVSHCLTRLTTILDITASPSKDLTVQWLLNFKCGGRRVLAFLDATQTSGPPWPGFPFTACPW